MQVDFTASPLQSNLYLSQNLQEADPFWKTVNSLQLPIVLLIEEAVAPLFSKTIESFLPIAHKLCLSGGEQAKSFSSLEKILSFLQEKNLGKDTCLLAVGGGAFLDLAGFTASIYARGIPLVTIPTTLLSMVDACLGGKTAINFGGKNSIGTFYPAKHILISSSFLSSLSDEQKTSGLAEVIKYGLIVDKDLFTLLQQRQDLWKNQDPIFLEKIIGLSLTAKKFVVEKDFHDTGVRKILNFGHTIGHALESFFQYQILHGHAVSIGMLIESYLSYKMALLSKEDLDEILDLIKKYGFLEKAKSFSYLDIEPFIQKDKKSIQKTPTFVLLSSIGKAYGTKKVYSHLVPKKILLESIDWYQNLLL